MRRRAAPRWRSGRYSFNIGQFPYFCLLSLVLFAQPSAPRAWGAKLAAAGRRAAAAAAHLGKLAMPAADRAAGGAAALVPASGEAAPAPVIASLVDDPKPPVAPRLDFEKYCFQQLESITS